MSKIALGLSLLFICSVSGAHEPTPTGLEFVGGYTYLHKPNEGQNYESAGELRAGIEHPITSTLSGRLLFCHINEVEFPAIDDPKGAWGNLRGYGGSYGIYNTFPITDNLGFVLGGAVAYYDWDFRENPLLQENNVIVDVDASLAYEATVGLLWKVNDAWSVEIDVSWFDTDIDKSAVDNKGVVWNILDADNTIGLQYIGLSARGKYKF